MKTGTMLRRFDAHEKRTPWSELKEDNPALAEGRSIFNPARLAHPDFVERVLKSGHNNKKIGAEVQKGKWSGMPVYTLTLEERATCPRSCLHWRDCFGNKMKWPYRHEHGTALENCLLFEVRDLARKHPKGFVVRLHILGDFYSLRYAALWASMVDLCPQLHVYGYTAHPPQSEIGQLITHARFHAQGRFAVRHSNSTGPWSTKTFYEKPSTPTQDGYIICPAQTGGTDCCGTCGLCWNTDRPIGFLAH